MGVYQGQTKSIIDNCMCFEFISACSLSFTGFKRPVTQLCFVCHLTSLCGLQQDLKDLMRKAGEVTFVDAHRPNRNEGWDSVNSSCRPPLDFSPHGSSCPQRRVVEFASRSDMKNAISKLDGTELNGRKLKIFEDSRKWVLFSCSKASWWSNKCKIFY